MRDRRRYLVARRISQLAILLGFVAGPWFGVFVARGTLASSVWFDTVSLTDPFVVLQGLLAGHWPAIGSATGALVVVVFLAIAGGRFFCGWICPIDVVADAARGLRTGLGWRRASVLRIDRRLRYVLLFVVLAGSFLGGAIVWELVNPITMTLRALAFGLWTGGLVAVIGIFLFDFLLLSNGWCGHVCPVGAFYGAIGGPGLLRVSAARRSACTDCGECFRHCPEPQVIGPALRGVDGHGPRIVDIDCLRCGRCIDVCDEGVFAFSILAPVVRFEGDERANCQRGRSRFTAGPDRAPAALRAGSGRAPSTRTAP